MSSSLTAPIAPGPKPARNPNVPAIPQPIADLNALAVVTMTLKQAVDSLGGSRGKPTDRAVTFNDLTALGLASSAALSASSSSSDGTLIGVEQAARIAGDTAETARAEAAEAAITTVVNENTAAIAAEASRAEAAEAALARAAEWNAGTVTALGTGLSLTGGILAPSWAAGTTSRIGTGLTLSAGTLSAAPAEIWNAGTVTAVGTGLAISAGTLAASGIAFAVGTGLTSSGGTLSLGTIAAGKLMGNAATIGAVPGAVAIGTGLSLSVAGTLSAAAAEIWNAGTVTTVGSGLTLSSGTINLEASQGTRDITFSIVGKPPASQPYNITVTQPGTLLANGGAPQAYIPTTPTNNENLVLNTVHSGTITTQGTLIVTGGTVLASNGSIVAASKNTFAGNIVYYGRVTAAAAGTVVSLSMDYPSNVNSTVMFALYSDNGSGTAPATLLAQTNTLVVSSALGQITLNTTTNPAITNGASYWVAMMASGSLAQWETGSVTSPVGQQQSTASFAFPASASTLSALGYASWVEMIISPSAAGAVTWPTFSAVTLAAGDSIQIVNQATQDATFKDACFALQFRLT